MRNSALQRTGLFRGLWKRNTRAPVTQLSTSAPGHNAGKPTSPPMEPITSQAIMQLASNRAMRFVYLRTLPLAKTPAVADSVEHIASEIEDVAARVCEKHIARVTDDRAAIHLHMGALAIASHRVLWPRIKSDIVVDNMIRAGFGAQLLPTGSSGDAQVAETKLPAYWIARFALLFSFNRMNAVRKMAANVAKDFGDSFQVETTDEADGDVHRLVIRKCFYHSLCKAEELPQLTKLFCALDKALFSPISTSVHGVDFSLTETLADEREHDSKCNFVFTRVSSQSN